MESKYKYFSKNLFLFTLSSIGSKVITFFLVPIYTNFLSTKEYGVIDLIGTLTSITLPVFTFSLEASVLRFCMDERYKQEDVFNVATYIWGRSLLINIALTFVVYFGGIFDSYDNFIGYYLLSYFLTGAKDILTNYYRGIERVEIMAETTLLNSILLCAFNILFLTGCKMGLKGYILAFTYSSIICILWGGYRVRKSILFKWKIKNEKLMREMQAYGGPLIFNQIGWWINNSVDKYIVIFFLGISQNGIYSMAYRLPTILSVLSGVFSNAWSLSIIKELGSDDVAEFSSLIHKMYNAMLVIGCSLLLVLNVPIAKLLFAKEFYVAWEITGVLLVSVVFNGLAGFFGSFFAAVKDTKSYAVSTIAGGIVNIAISILLVNLWGIKGVAIGTLSAYIVIWLIRYYKCKQYVRLKTPMFKNVVMYILLIVECIIGMQKISFMQIIIQLSICLLLVVLNLEDIKIILQKVANLIIKKG